jgi:hypothetical protein
MWIRSILPDSSSSDEEHDEEEWLQLIGCVLVRMCVCVYI